MAKSRVINTKFWSDSYITELDPLERYLYLYFLTNEHTDICGIYELPLRVMAFETGLDKEMLYKIIKRYEADRKIYYFDGWLIIKNFIKNQEIKTQKNNVYKGIMNGLKRVPMNIWNMIRTTKGLLKEIINPIKGLEGALRDLKELQLSESESESELESESESESEKPKETKKLTPKEIAVNFFNQVNSLIQNKTEEAAELQEYLRELADKGIPKDVLWLEVQKFADYWTETNKAGTKQKWELEKTFEVNRRLLRWFRNANQIGVSRASFTKRTKTIIE